MFRTTLKGLAALSHGVTRRSGVRVAAPRNGERYGSRASSTRLSGDSAARRTAPNPASRSTSAMRASPACVPSPARARLGQRAGRAHERREPVVEAPDRVEVLLDRVARERLDEHHRAAGGEHVRRVARGGERVPEVVERVEERHEVVARAGVVRGAGDLEAHAVVDARLAGALARGGDRVGVVVDPDEVRGRERLGQQDRRRAVAAADVGDERPGLELGDDAVERRQPLRQQVRAVGGRERALGAVPQVVVVLVPADAVTLGESLDQALADRHGGVRGLERAVHRERARLVGEHEGVLGREDVGAVARRPRSRSRPGR